MITYTASSMTQSSMPPSEQQRRNANNSVRSASSKEVTRNNKQKQQAVLWVHPLEPPVHCLMLHMLCLRSRLFFALVSPPLRERERVVALWSCSALLWVHQWFSALPQLRCHPHGTLHTVHTYSSSGSRTYLHNPADQHHHSHMKDDKERTGRLRLRLSLRGPPDHHRQDTHPGLE